MVRGVGVPRPSAGQARLRRPPKVGARPRARAEKGNKFRVAQCRPATDMVGATVPRLHSPNGRPDGRWTDGQQRAEVAETSRR